MPFMSHVWSKIVSKYWLRWFHQYRDQGSEVFARSAGAHLRWDGLDLLVACLPLPSSAGVMMAHPHHYCNLPLSVTRSSSIPEGGTWCVNRVQATFLIYGWTALNSVKKGCPPYFKLDIHLLVRLPIRNESGCQEQVGWRTWHRLHLIAHIVAFRWTIRALFSSAVINNIRW